MQIKVWVHVIWLVPGAGYREEIADKGIGVRKDHAGVLGSENWPCTSRSLVSQQMLPGHPLHPVLCTEQNTRASGRFLSKQVPVPSAPHAR